MRSLLKFFSRHLLKQKMPKSQERKLFKCVRKTINGDKNFLAVKFKNLSSSDIREVKTEINVLLKDFWTAPILDEAEYSEDENTHLVHFSEDTKQ